MVFLSYYFWKTVGEHRAKANLYQQYKTSGVELRGVLFECRTFAHKFYIRGIDVGAGPIRTHSFAYLLPSGEGLCVKRGVKGHVWNRNMKILVLPGLDLSGVRKSIVQKDWKTASHVSFPLVLNLFALAIVHFFILFAIFYSTLGDCHKENESYINENDKNKCIQGVATRMIVSSCILNGVAYVSANLVVAKWKEDILNGADIDAIIRFRSPGRTLPTRRVDGVDLQEILNELEATNQEGEEIAAKDANNSNSQQGSLRAKDGTVAFDETTVGQEEMIELVNS